MLDNPTFLEKYKTLLRTFGPKLSLDPRNHALSRSPDKCQGS